MHRNEKEAIVEEATALLAGANALYVSDYRGLTVAELTELRGKLREAEIYQRVDTEPRTIERRSGTDAKPIIRAKPAVAKGRYLKSIHFASTMGPSVEVDSTRTRDLMEA